MDNVNVILISVSKDGYGIEEVEHTMTVGDVMAKLSRYDSGAKLYVTADDGYSYCGVMPGDIDQWAVDSDGAMSCIDW